MVFLRKTRDYLLHLEADEETFRLARILRNSMTEVEIKLWQAIKNRKISSLKFRRQHPIHYYIADFYCHEKRLIIEVDGEIHKRRSVKEHDENRSAELDRLGITVIRFTNDQVIKSLPEVLKEIERFSSTLPTISPSP